MATPYLQLRRYEVPSTQDLARAELERLPVVVICQRQSAGRGRGGAAWVTAPRALAASVAFRVGEADHRPLSLMAGVAASRVIDGISLKWPNDLLADHLKVGGILVERSGRLVVVGIGVNLWWPEAPEGMGALFEEDPGPDLHARIGGLWAAELLQLVTVEGWPVEEYREACETLGSPITWEPDGSGIAIDVNDHGELLVERGGERHVINSGVIRHLRHRGGSD
jgi:BirA family biotin operon repressor/biotin-[acetyl-CoA-carboxylase] ligase